jgi:hypothetical protein
VQSATRPERFSPPTFGTPGRGLSFYVFACYPFDTMVQIAEHQDEASKDFLLEEGAASATPQESDCRVQSHQPHGRI